MTATNTEFRLPDLGEGVHEGQVLRLCVGEGDPIAEDQILMEVETDKAAVEIPCPVTGHVAQWHVKERQTVNVGDLMVTFAMDGSAVARRPAPVAEAIPASSHGGGGSATADSPAESGTRRSPASPAVRKLARARGIDLESIRGTGPGGRILRADVERAADAPPTPVVAPDAPAVTQLITRVPAPSPMTSAAAGRETREKLTRFRLTVANVMTEAARTIPHVTDCDDADVTTLESIRKDFNADVAKGNGLGTLAFVIAAVARALRAFPVFNASFDAEAGEVVYHGAVHIAIGVQTDRGLVAPVLRHVDAMTLREINTGVAELTERARASSFTREETQGGTYTISNAGAMGGSRYATPIITPPQVAVLAVGRTRLMPWVVEGAVVPRRIMPLSHSMDHRLIDGAVEIAFMRHVIRDLESPLRLFA